jgi:hypothetical protein
MPTPEYVIHAGKLVQVVRSARRYRTDGFDVINPTGDPGSRPGGTTNFVAGYLVHPAEVGTTVCRHARGTHWCGLVHVTPEQATAAGLVLA